MVTNIKYRIRSVYRIGLRIFILSLLLCSAAPVLAFSKQFTVSNKFGDGVFGTVNVSQLGSNILFHVTPANQYKIKRFGFNALDSLGVKKRNIFVLGDGWRVKKNKEMNGFGQFDFLLKTRKKQESLTFGIVGVSGDEVLDYFQGNPSFFYSGQFLASKTSGLPRQFVAAVPEPEVWLMMVAGVGLLGWAIHRRRKSTDDPPSTSRMLTAT